MVLVRLRPYPLGPVPGGLRDGQVLPRIRTEEGPPPYGAEAWSADGGRTWQTAFGGRWLEKGDGRLEWEWLT